MINNIFSDKKGKNSIRSVFIDGLKWGVYEHWPEVKTILAVSLECTNFKKIDKVLFYFYVKAPLMSHQNSPTTHCGKKCSVRENMIQKYWIISEERGASSTQIPFINPCLLRKT